MKTKTENQAEETKDWIETVKEIEVKEAVVVEKKRKASVTMKTLKAWFEQSKRIAENELLSKEDEVELLRITKAVKEKFINENF